MILELSATHTRLIHVKAWGVEKHLESGNGASCIQDGVRKKPATTPLCLELLCSVCELRWRDRRRVHCTRQLQSIYFEVS